MRLQRSSAMRPVLAALAFASVGCNSILDIEPATNDPYWYVTTGGSGGTYYGVGGDDYGGGGTDSSGGTGSTVGAGGYYPGGGTGGGNVPIGDQVPFYDGWAAIEENRFGIQGPLFPYADDTSAAYMSYDFSNEYACIWGETAIVDPNCVLTADDILNGVTDCYGKHFGAAIGFFLNMHPDSLEPMSFDASEIMGIQFNLNGSVPGNLRFKVISSYGEEFCTPDYWLTSGTNYVYFDDLMYECWNGSGFPPLTSDVVQIAWQVVTNTSWSTVYDFCVSDLYAIPWD